MEDESFGDVRFDVLAQLCGLADADHARGKMARFYRQCTAEDRYSLPESVIVAVLGPKGPDALITAGLGERVTDVARRDRRRLAAGELRIRGTKGRVEWLSACRAGASNGGRSRVRNAKRDAKGRLLKSSPGLDETKPVAPAHSSVPAAAAATATVQGDSSSAAAYALAQFYPDLPPAFADELATDHPGVDVAAAIRKARRWEDDHPQRRKKNKRSFLRSWMGRERPANRAERASQASIGYAPPSSGHREGLFELDASGNPVPIQAGDA